MIDIDLIIKEVAKHFNMREKDVIKRCRARRNVTARCYVYKVAFDHGMSHSKISNSIKTQKPFDRNTIRHAINTFHDELKLYKSLADDYSNFLLKVNEITKNT